MEQQGSPFRFTSPVLQSREDRMMRECPVGYILRECSYVYDLLDAAVVADNTGLDFLSAPRYLQHAVRLISSEKYRVSELKRKEDRARRKGARDSSYAANVLKAL